MEFKSRSRGFTLVELITASGLVGLVILLAVIVYLAQFRLFSNQNTAVDVASQNKLALDEIANQIRQSQKVVTTCANCAGDTTSASVLILQLWPLDASGEPFEPPISEYDYIVYKIDPQDNTRLLKKIVADPASSRTTTTRVAAITLLSLNFSYDTADPSQASGIDVTITTSAYSGSKTQTTTQGAKAVLRNK